VNRSAILGFPYFFGTSIGMTSSPSVAANLSNDARKGLAILSLSKAEPIAHLARIMQRFDGYGALGGVIA
jgi:hypothetical protein